MAAATGMSGRVAENADTVEICGRMNTFVSEVNDARDTCDPESHLHIVQALPGARSISFMLEDPAVFLNGTLDVQGYGDRTKEYFGAESRCVFDTSMQLYSIVVSRAAFGHFL
jgi:hypothetical protein